MPARTRPWRSFGLAVPRRRRLAPACCEEPVWLVSWWALRCWRWPSARAGASGQETAGRPAAPRPAIAAIVEAFGQHRIVGLGDAHGNRLGEAFQLALIADPGFLAVVDDLVVESGNSRYQELADRFVRGEDVDPAALRRIWLDTTQQQAVSADVPALFTDRARTQRVTAGESPPARPPRRATHRVGEAEDDG